MFTWNVQLKKSQKKLKLSIDKCAIMIYTMYIIRNGGNKKNEKQNFKGNQLHYGIYLFILCLPT